MTATWDELRRHEEAKPYWARLQRFLAEERANYQVLPDEDQVFAALTATPFDAVNVVIVGQDPYPTLGHAHGLAFSVMPGVEIPDSLRNIYAELAEDLGQPAPTHGNLEHWAEEGVLLLNTTLTVRAGARKSHTRAEWWRFTHEVLRALGSSPEPTVFILWGASARKRRRLIEDHHCVIESSHPSPLSAHRTGRTYDSFFGSKPFTRANKFLKAHGRGPVEWNFST